jgi:putative transposase
MSRNYKYGDPRNTHFITYTVINWIDFFIREEYRKILIQSIEYCQQNKGLELYAYCIMTSHVHLIVRTSGNYKLSDFSRDLKGYTSKQFHKLLKSEQLIHESRQKWLVWMMERAGKHNSNNKGFQFWQQDSHSIELWSDEVFQQKLEYIHLNPVAAGFVNQPEDWRYSSAMNYAGLPVVLDLVAH